MLQTNFFPKKGTLFIISKSVWNHLLPSSGAVPQPNQGPLSLYTHPSGSRQSDSLMSSWWNHVLPSLGGNFSSLLITAEGILWLFADLKLGTF